MDYSRLQYHQLHITPEAEVCQGITSKEGRPTRKKAQQLHRS